MQLQSNVSISHSQLKKKHVSKTNVTHTETNGAFGVSVLLEKTLQSDALSLICKNAVTVV